jgi:hypothetical protein
MGNKASKVTEKLPETIEGYGEVLLPPRIGPLNKHRGARTELARVYRQVRRGEIPPDVGTKLVYMLHTLSRVLEVETFDERLGRVEKALEVDN